VTLFLEGCAEITIVKPPPAAMLSRLPDGPILGRSASLHLFVYNAESVLERESLYFDGGAAQLTVTHVFEGDRSVVESEYACDRFDAPQFTWSDDVDAEFSVRYFYNHFVPWCDWRSGRLQVREDAFGVSFESRRITQSSDTWVYRSPRGNWLQLETLFAASDPEFSKQLHVLSGCADGSFSPRNSHEDSVQSAVDYFLDVTDRECKGVGVVLERTL